MQMEQEDKTIGYAFRMACDYAKRDATGAIPLGHPVMTPGQFARIEWPWVTRAHVPLEVTPNGRGMIRGRREFVQCHRRPTCE